MKYIFIVHGSTRQNKLNDFQQGTKEILKTPVNYTSIQCATFFMLMDVPSLHHA